MGASIVEIESLVARKAFADICDDEVDSPMPVRAGQYICDDTGQKSRFSEALLLVL